MVIAVMCLGFYFFSETARNAVDPTTSGGR